MAAPQPQVGGGDNKGHEAVAAGKPHFRDGGNYGFSEEILLMHLHAGKGAPASARL